MINKKEFGIIALISIILGATLSFSFSPLTALYTLLAVFLAIILNVFGKKATSYLLDSEIEISIWDIKRYGFKRGEEFKKPILAGIIFPILISIVSLGHLSWFANLTFDVKSKAYRAAKRWGIYSFSEVTEWHMGIIALGGIILNLLFAVIGYLLGFEEFARINSYIAFFSILPFSNLDGNKIFFASIVLWSFVAALALIFFAYAIFLI